MTANQTESFPLLNWHDIAGLLVQGLLGLTAEYPAERRYLEGRLKPEGPYNASEFRSALNMSARDSMALFEYQDIFEFFAGGKPDVYTPAMIDVMNREGVAGTYGAPKVPVFVHHAMADEYCPGDTVDRVVAKFCAAGANILYHRNVVGNHNRQLSNAQRSVIAYLADLLEGKNLTGYPAVGCMVENISVQYDDVPFW